MLSILAQAPAPVPGPPEWLIYVTPIVAALAFGVAVWSLVTARSSLKTARRTYDRAGAILSGMAALVSRVFSEESEDESGIVYVNLWNSGLSAVSIDAINLVDTVEPRRLMPRPLHNTELCEELDFQNSGKLPFTLAGQSSFTGYWELSWLMPAAPRAQRGRITEWSEVFTLAMEMEVHVKLGSGETTVVPILGSQTNRPARSRLSAPFKRRNQLPRA